MKKPLCVLMIVFLMSACRMEYTPLKGHYPSDYTIVFDKPADKVMTNIIEYCLENNISLKAIDRKSGLIMSEPYRIDKFTFENENGMPQDTSARVIIGREAMKASKNDYFEPEVVNTEIIFRVREENNKTSMTIMLANTSAYLFEGRSSCLREVKSTGYLEKQIIEGMK